MVAEGFLPLGVKQLPRNNESSKPRDGSLMLNVRPVFKTDRGAPVGIISASVFVMLATRGDI